MAPIIYRRQRQILDFIKLHIDTTGSAPTLKQIAKALGVSSLATVHEHLQALERKGLIQKKAGASRGISLIDGAGSPLSQGLEVPIMGYIAAGLPIEPYTDPNATLSISPGMVSTQKRVFVL